MKIKQKKLILIILIIAIICGVAYSYPYKVNNTFQGIRFKVNDKKLVQGVNIKIKGRYTKGIFWNDRFTGTIYVDGHELSRLDFKFGKKRFDFLNSINSTTHGIETYGLIYASSKFDKLTVLVNDTEKDSWDEKSGIIISAPVTNRQDGLTMYNEFIKNAQK